MKTYFSLKIGLTFGLVSVLMFTSCQNDEISEASLLEEEKELEFTEDAEESDPTLRINTSVLFPITARLFGKSNEDWAKLLGKAAVAFDCENVLQPHMLKLADKVVAPYGSLDKSTVEYTISKDNFVFLSPAFFLNFYPCPEEYDWEPADGQSIEEFLMEYAKEVVDAVESLEVIFDGKKISSINHYRLNSDLFYFIGNSVLAECYDDCITGGSQPGLVDGYFMMFKKMKVGKHTMVVKGEVPSSDFTFENTLVLNVIN